MRDRNSEKLLIRTWIDEEIEIKREKSLKEGFKLAVLVGVVFGLVMLALLASCAVARADNKIVVKASDYIDGIHISRWADAIYWAEGGEKTAHKYGILKRYRHTTPRQACINTIRHKYRDFLSGGHSGSFLAYLASRYAPLNAANDPTGLNKNWIKNVQYYLNNPKPVKG